MMEKERLTEKENNNNNHDSSSKNKASKPISMHDYEEINIHQSNLLVRPEKDKDNDCFTWESTDTNRFETTELSNLVEIKGCININQNELVINTLYLCSCQNDRNFLVCEECKNKCHKDHDNFIEVKCYSNCKCEELIDHKPVTNFDRIAKSFKKRCFFEPLFEYFPNKGYFKVKKRNVDDISEKPIINYFCAICAVICYKNLSISIENKTPTITRKEKFNNQIINYEYTIERIIYNRSIRCDCNKHDPPTLITFYDEICGAEKYQKKFEITDCMVNDQLDQVLDPIIEESPENMMENNNAESDSDDLTEIDKKVVIKTNNNITAPKEIENPIQPQDDSKDGDLSSNAMAEPDEDKYEDLNVLKNNTTNNNPNNTTILDNELEKKQTFKKNQDIKYIDLSNFFYNFNTNFIAHSTVDNINDYYKILISPMTESIELNLKKIMSKSENINDILITFYTNFYNQKSFQLIFTLMKIYFTKYTLIENPFSHMKLQIFQIYQHTVDYLKPSQADVYFMSRFNFANMIFEFFIKSYIQKYNNTFDIYAYTNFDIVERVLMSNYSLRFKDFYLKNDDEKNYIEFLSNIQTYTEYLYKDMNKCCIIHKRYINESFIENVNTYTKILNFLIKYNLICDEQKVKHFELMNDILVIFFEAYVEEKKFDDNNSFIDDNELLNLQKYYDLLNEEDDYEEDEFDTEKKIIKEEYQAYKSNSKNQKSKREKLKGAVDILDKTSKSFPCSFIINCIKSILYYIVQKNDNTFIYKYHNKFLTRKKYNIETLETLLKNDEKKSWAFNSNYDMSLVCKNFANIIYIYSSLYYDADDFFSMNKKKFDYCCKKIFEILIGNSDFYIGSLESIFIEYYKEIESTVNNKFSNIDLNDKIKTEHFSAFAKKSDLKGVVEMEPLFAAYNYNNDFNINHQSRMHKKIEFPAKIDPTGFSVVKTLIGFLKEFYDNNIFYSNLMINFDVYIRLMEALFMKMCNFVELKKNNSGNDDDLVNIKNAIRFTPFFKRFNEFFEIYSIRATDSNLLGIAPECIKKVLQLLNTLFSSTSSEKIKTSMFNTINAELFFKSMYIKKDENKELIKLIQTITLQCSNSESTIKNVKNYVFLCSLIDFFANETKNYIQEITSSNKLRVTGIKNTFIMMGDFIDIMKTLITNISIQNSEVFSSIMNLMDLLKFIKTHNKMKELLDTYYTHFDKGEKEFESIMQSKIKNLSMKDNKFEPHIYDNNNDNEKTIKKNVEENNKSNTYHFVPKDKLERKESFYNVLSGFYEKYFKFLNFCYRKEFYFFNIFFNKGEEFCKMEDFSDKGRIIDLKMHISNSLKFFKQNSHSIDNDNEENKAQEKEPIAHFEDKDMRKLNQSYKNVFKCLNPNFITKFVKFTYNSNTKYNYHFKNQEDTYKLFLSFLSKTNLKAFYNSEDTNGIENYIEFVEQTIDYAKDIIEVLDKMKSLKAKLEILKIEKKHSGGDEEIKKIEKEIENINKIYKGYNFDDSDKKSSKNFFDLLEDGIIVPMYFINNRYYFKREELAGKEYFKIYSINFKFTGLINSMINSEYFEDNYYNKPGSNKLSKLLNQYKNSNEKEKEKEKEIDKVRDKLNNIYKAYTDKDHDHKIKYLMDERIIREFRTQLYHLIDKKYLNTNFYDTSRFIYSRNFLFENTYITNKDNNKINNINTAMENYENDDVKKLNFNYNNNTLYNFIQTINDYKITLQKSYKTDFCLIKVFNSAEDEADKQYERRVFKYLNKRLLNFNLENDKNSGNYITLDSMYVLVYIRNILYQLDKIEKDSLFNLKPIIDDFDEVQNFIKTLCSKILFPCFFSESLSFLNLNKDFSNYNISQTIISNVLLIIRILCRDQTIAKYLFNYDLTFFIDEKLTKAELIACLKDKNKMDEYFKNFSLPKLNKIQSNNNKGLPSIMRSKKVSQMSSNHSEDNMLTDKNIQQDFKDLKDFSKSLFKFSNIFFLIMRLTMKIINYDEKLNLSSEKNNSIIIYSDTFSLKTMFFRLTEMLIEGVNNQDTSDVSYLEKENLGTDITYYDFQIMLFLDNVKKLCSANEIFKDRDNNEVKSYSLKLINSFLIHKELKMPFLNYFILLFDLEFLIGLSIEFTKILVVKYLDKVSYKDPDFEEKYVKIELDESVYESKTLYKKHYKNYCYDYNFLIGLYAYQIVKLLADKHKLPQAVQLFSDDKKIIKYNSSSVNSSNIYSYVSSAYNSLKILGKATTQVLNKNQTIKKLKTNMAHQTLANKNLNEKKNLVELYKKSIKTIDRIPEKFTKFSPFAMQFICNLYNWFINKVEFINEDEDLEEVYYIVDSQALIVTSNEISEMTANANYSSKGSKIVSLINFVDLMILKIRFFKKFKVHNNYIYLYNELNYKLFDYASLLISIVINILQLTYYIDIKDSHFNTNNGEKIFTVIIVLGAIQIAVNFIGLILFLIIKYPFLNYSCVVSYPVYYKNIYIQNLYKYFDIFIYKNLITNKDVFLILGNLIIGIVSICSQSLMFLYSLQLISILRVMKTVEEIFMAFEKRIMQVIIMVLFLAVIVNFFANIAYYALNQQFITTEVNYNFEPIVSF